MTAKILLLDKLLNSSSSSSDEEMMAVLMQNEMRIQIPKVRHMMDIINEYSDKEVCYIICNFNTYFNTYFYIISFQI